MKVLDTPQAAPGGSADSQAPEPTATLYPEPSRATQNAPALLQSLVVLFLCLTVLAVFMPLNPPMPVSGLDASWMFAMNQAVAQRLVFGRDMVFTFGPYAPIYTELYHPATDRLMIWGSLFLGFAYCALLLFLRKGKPFYLLFIYGLFLAGFMNSRDALLFSYPLILALLVYRITLPDGHANALPPGEPYDAVLPIFFAPLGLLPLIKASLLPLCGLIAALCCGMLWRCGKRILAYMATGTAVVSCVLLWAAAHQPVLALPGFFWSTKEIVSGYTEAMAFAGDSWEYILYVLAGAFILAAVARSARGTRISAWFLGISISFFLFTSFKAGFIRHDPWHDITAGSAILAVALLLPFVLEEKRALVPILMAVLAWTYIDNQTLQSAPAQVSRNFTNTFLRAYEGVRKRLSDGELQKEYGQHIAAIRAQFPIAPMPGTADIYSFNQSWLLASGNTWAPRPVVQSYSVYTSELAQRNLAHLTSDHAPDNIVFRVEPIDGRLPSLEDGLSWSTLINGYSLQKLDALAMYLRRKSTEKPAPPIVSNLLYATHQFDEEVSLPKVDEPLFATMEISPTFLGRIRGILFKPPPLYISLRLRDDREMKYRAISNMMQTDFLLTPLVKSTEEFALFAAGGVKYLTSNEVASFRISTEDRKGWFWKSAYSVNLHKIDLSKNTEIENSHLFDMRIDAAPPSLSPPTMLNCEGSIESINGSRPSPAIATIEGNLSLSGWMGVDAKNGIVPDSVFVMLTSEAGKSIYIQAHSTRRDDVTSHFHQPSMPDPGYAALIDVSSLKGKYTLDLARMYKGNLGICRQFRRPLRINP